MRHRPRRIVAAALPLLLAMFAFARVATLAHAQPTPHTHRIFVDAFPDQPGAAALRSAVIARLRFSPGVRLVDSDADAEAIVTGDGETWVKGYVSVSTRGTAGQPVLGGYLSLALKDSRGNTLWSYMVTPGGMGQDMAGRIVPLLVAALAHPGHAAPEPAAAPAGQIALTGAGATFPAPLYQEWIQNFQQQHPDLRITYQPVGSSEGIRLLQQGSVDFAASDAFLTVEQMSALGVHFDHFATVLGGVVPAYNLAPAARDLNFTPEVLAAIYLGKITRWNDPRLRELNHGAALPDQPITVLHRSDGSGTTFAFTSLLAATVPEWKSLLGGGLTISWPVGIPAEGNEGVAAAIANTPGAIGYVELTYAVRHRLNFGLVRNAAGRFIQANLESLNAASVSAASSADFRRSLVNAPGKDAYPIATFTWLLLPHDAKSPQKATALRELVRWMLTAGQKECSGLEYLPLPRSLADRELAALNP